ncbi:cytochrome p450 monooxygenase [Colletotrichum karsti]|uniref:Cytochrome p450 monooxygenase n=1 Tax=Colletotrichum karsti TaxID=1095194 RepID=A0A9P6LID8_9PEZI|nr:cytochrome p450 monooxygenase [Colletotrichum karsti]KAF9877214.1 cytochrome p450 monooxygenase [Colletotrichum karsti]
MYPSLLTLSNLPVSLPALLGCVAFAGCVVYIIYQRYFHPLADFPGPFWASVTDLWQVIQFLSLKQPYNLTELHEKYGEFVRYGPDNLSITAEEVVPLVYQKGGRRMPKTEYYDAFGSNIPNVFGMRDVELHSIRRRHMSNSFSLSSVKGMEHHLDENIKLLREKITKFANDGESFDLKKLLHYYTIDVLGELAFSRSFGVQISDDESLVPPVVPHTLLGSMTGSWPAMTQTLKKWLPRIPHPGLRALFEGRAKCARLAVECVRRRLGELEKQEGESAKDGRTDLLTNLILAKHPDSGEKLARIDLEAEAFGFIIAGTHTTSATTTLLFWNLLHNLESLSKCVREIDQHLTPLDDEKTAYSTSVAVCNHAFHHNPRVWGDDHGNFDPSRWENEETAERARYLMHFGLGGRQCIGKALAQTNIYKLASTLLGEFDFQLADAQERDEVKKGSFTGKLPPMAAVGGSDLDGPLMVTASTRLSKDD